MIKRNFSIFFMTILLVTIQSIYAQPGGFGGRGGMGGMPGGMGGGRGGGMFGGMNQRAEYVPSFDKDDNGWLNNEERMAARESMGNRQAMGGRNMGRGGRGGGFGGGSYEKGIELTPADVKSYSKKESLYDLDTLRTIFLEFENEDWESELEFFYHSDVDVPAKMIVDGKEYENVGVRFRGNTSYMMVGTGGKRPINLSVDYIKDKQKLYGYKTLNLMNCNSDPTFMRQVLYHQITREYIPASKANFVRLVINGENWGIYVNLQQFNKDFIRDEFNTTKGARWKIPQMSPNGGLVYVGDDIESYKRTYEIKSKDDAESWKALVNLCKILNETPADKLESALRPILDIEGALKFLAIEKALVNSDGYWTRASDYLLYMDPTGRFHVFPYDTSETISEAEGGPGGGRGGRGGFTMSTTSNRTMLDPLAGANDYDKPLLSKLLAVPSLKEKYYEYLHDIAENWMDWEKLEPIVEQYKSLIAEDIEIDTKKNSTTEAFYSGIDSSSEQTINTASYGFGGGRGGRGGPGRGSSMSLKDFFETRRAELLNIEAISQAD